MKSYVAASSNQPKYGEFAPILGVFPANATTTLRTPFAATLCTPSTSKNAIILDNLPFPMSLKVLVAAVHPQQGVLEVVVEAEVLGSAVAIANEQEVKWREPWYLINNNEL
ncbi:unnamed protein product [Aphanomyces euteiches]